ncbi:GNAT family N-acetyltransferase [bacterium]|nr:MAG: GNAT family N-acetyltransferase [bacterium]
MSITARKAIAADIPILVEMMEEFYAESNFPLDLHWSRNTFAALIANETFGTIWLINYEDIPIGYSVLAVQFSMEYGGLSGSIEDLFIRPTHRRQGAGRCALETLLDACEERGLVAVQVETGPANKPAQLLYETYGLDQRTDHRLTFTHRFTDDSDILK